MRGKFGFNIKNNFLTLKVFRSKANKLNTGRIQAETEWPPRWDAIKGILVLSGSKKQIQLFIQQMS